jgi:hypothetical protein
MKRGDFFQEKDGTVYMLAQVDLNTLCLISLEDGNRWTEPVKVKNHREITNEEMRRIFAKVDGSEFTPVKIETKIIQ